MVQTTFPYDTTWSWIYEFMNDRFTMWFIVCDLFTSEFFVYGNKIQITDWFNSQSWTAWVLWKVFLESSFFPNIKFINFRQCAKILIVWNQRDFIQQSPVIWVSRPSGRKRKVWDLQGYIFWKHKSVLIMRTFWNSCEKTIFDEYACMRCTRCHHFTACKFVKIQFQL